MSCICTLLQACHRLKQQAYVCQYNVMYVCTVTKKKKKTFLDATHFWITDLTKTAIKYFPPKICVANDMYTV